MKRFTLSLTGLFMVAAAIPAWGGMVLYTDESAFTAVLPAGYYLEEFGDYNSYKFLGAVTLTFGPVNDYKFTVSSTPSGGLYSVTAGAGAISTLYGDDMLVITFTGDPVHAVGGRFFGTNYYGDHVTATMRLVLSDGTVEQYSNVNIMDFRGFKSSQAFTSLAINVPGADYDDGPYPTLDHLYVGAPEPATLALLGIGLVGLLVRPRRK
jgi:hypothetical protein